MKVLNVNKVLRKTLAKTFIWQMSLSVYMVGLSYSNGKMKLNILLFKHHVNFWCPLVATTHANRQSVHTIHHKYVRFGSNYIVVKINLVDVASINVWCAKLAPSGLT